MRNGWNITGDTYRQDEDGYFWFQARNDDMIVSSGYNIAGPEVEAASCSAIPPSPSAPSSALPDDGARHDRQGIRGARPGHAASDGLIRALQDHVKAEIAPYKYPRAIAFLDVLPRTKSGKVKRFALRGQTPAPPPGA